MRARPRSAEPATTTAGALADAFRAAAARKDGGVRLVVARPAEPGTDTVEVYLVRRGRTLTVAELVSDRGFPPRFGTGAGGGQSLKSGRTNSSNVSRSQLATTEGVSARIDAVRGTFIISATSPK